MTVPDKADGWTVRGLLALLPNEHPMWFRNAVGTLREPREAFVAALQASMAQQTGDMARVYVAMTLLGLGDVAGAQVFLEILRAGELKAQRYAVGELGTIWQCCRVNHDSNRLDVPLDARQVVDALSAHLAVPDAEPGKTALWFCLSLAFDESQALMRAMLNHASSAVRVSVVEGYLSHGLDEGALQVAMAFLLSPAPDRDEARALWLRTANRYAVAMARACREGDEALARRAAQVARYVLQKTLAVAGIGLRATAKGDRCYIDELVDAVGHVPSEDADRALSDVIRSRTIAVCARARAVLAFSRDKARMGEGALALLNELVDDREATPAARGALLTQLADRIGVAALDALLRALRDPNLRSYVMGAILALPRGAHDVEVNAALKRALAELEDDGRQQLAQALLDRGEDDEAVVAALSPMEMMNWHWRRHGIDARAAADRLLVAGAMDAINDDALPRAVESPDEILLALLQHQSRTGLRAVQDDGYDLRNDQLFASLVGDLRPPLVIESLTQTRNEVYRERPVQAIDGQLQPASEGRPGEVIPLGSFEGTTFTIRYVHLGKPYTFTVNGDGSWLDVAGVLRAFNAFMARLGREERAYRVAWNKWGGDEWALFVVAKEEPFLKVAAELRIPLMDTRLKLPT